ncbi:MULTISPECIES: hypothetical protein [unclassified Prochlorococcus]|uniref:hypothetical protein n=1 Tax=unclassified Prochlorococcus TaxID=2627481 RepID=UPI000561C3DE|nr:MULTISPECIES: hypothetical protein [unclassified Prochlorococcus]
MNARDSVTRSIRSSRSNLEVGKTSPQDRLDASTLASRLQLQEEQRELTYTLVSLFIKSGILIIAIASFFKLGMASHQRINRNHEIASVLRMEKNKLERLYLKFDRLFSIGGKDRLMDEQDQWIEPKSRRIIWR